MMRHSQMWEVFIQERLSLASEGWKPSEDPFEKKVARSVCTREHMVCDLCLGVLQSDDWHCQWQTCEHPGA